MLLRWSPSGCFWISSSSLLNAWNVWLSLMNLPQTSVSTVAFILKHRHAARSWSQVVLQKSVDQCVCVFSLVQTVALVWSLYGGKTKFPSGAIVATAGITVGMTTGIPWRCCQRAHLVSKCQKNWCRSGTLHLSLHLSARKWVDIFLSVRLLLSFVFFCSNGLLVIIAWQMGALWGCWLSI